MRKQIVELIFVLFGCYFVKGDVKELNNGSNQHLTTSKTNQLKQEQFIYQYNKPTVIDDPLPSRVEYVQPLGIDDRVTGKYKPILKETLTRELFLNKYPEPHFFEIYDENVASANNVVSAYKIDTQPKLTKPSAFTNKSPLNLDTKADSTEKHTKYAKKLNDHVIPINYFAKKVTQFKLFNHDEDTKLNESAPVVIFKPGDDISFTKDTTIIDDYQYMFPMEIKEKIFKPVTITTATTTTAKRRSPLKAQISNETDPVESSASVENKSNQTKNGYVYDKPKIPFTF